MTLATRVIGTLLVDGGTWQLVHRVGFKTQYPRNSPLTQANVYARRSMDEILLLDVTAAEQGREPEYDLIASVVGETFLPVSYGGGITSAERARRVVAECGADRVVMGAARIELMGAVGRLLGEQAVVASVDHPHLSVHFAGICQRAGAGEILCQSRARDGTLSGYDLDLVRAVSSSVSVPIIASSGCGKPQDMVDAIRAGASAVAAGWMWDATDVVPGDCKKALAAAGFPVRMLAAA